MRKVIYTDERGYRHISLVRDSDKDDMARYGIPLDPPDVSNIDCEFLLREIHNALVDNELLTWDDIQKSTVGLNAACSVVKRRLSGLYQEKAKQKNKT